MKPLILNLTPTGMVPTLQDTPHVPLTVEAIARDVAQGVALGVSMVHLHARDVEGRPTPDPAVYGELIRRLRQDHPGLVLVVSTSGRTHPAFEDRAAVLDLAGDARPDMASLTLGSLNFAHTASLNSPEVIQRLAARMQERGIRPELEVFDLGMVNVAHYLIRKGLLTPPYYFNLILGNLATAQARLSHVALMVSELPEGSLWSLGGIGPAQLSMTGLGALMADGVRVGLEDNLHLDEERTRLATNTELVARVRAIAEAAGRGVATPGEVRLRLGL